MTGMRKFKLSTGGEQIGSLIYPQSVAAQGDSAERIRLGLAINGHVSSPLIFTGIFSAEECQRIMGLSGHRRQRAGTMMYAKPNIRKSTIAWIDIREDSQWLYGKVWNTFQAVNRWFEFDLFGLVDEIQFARYGVGDSFGWHLDAGGGQTSTRKLSMSVQLCDDAEYGGGDLEFCACPQLDPRRRRGTIIVFPSFLAHQVTPVTRGARCSLVAWAHGPTFK
jgi:predicted 2-oxoglutarate/Fe(II)-dependent dioxygenase YbiX